MSAEGPQPGDDPLRASPFPRGPLQTPLSPADLRDAWPVLGPDERVEGFLALERGEARDFFVSLASRGQAQILLGCPRHERAMWARLLPPDDAADVLQQLEPADRALLLAELEAPMRREVVALLAYAEDEAGGLMSPRFVRVRPEMTVDEAIRYVRRQAHERHIETVYYVYVLDPGQHLLGVVSFRQLLTAHGESAVQEVMHTDIVTVGEDEDAEAVAKVVALHDILAVPVVDAEGRMKGIVTVDDVVDVVQREATEDIQRMGGVEALDIPYMQTRFLPMLGKRGGWLSILFVGELLTASAMTRYEHEIASAVVLALFIPLIISSGGNAGSQASTLVIRAMALGEVRLRDWWLIVRRECAAGLALGALLAALGMLRVALWQGLYGSYGEHAPLLAVTLALSLVGVVLWGTLSGSMLPLLLRRLGFDPASASAPFVATLVDVAGLVIYFNVAAVVLKGTLL